MDPAHWSLKAKNFIFFILNVGLRIPIALFSISHLGALLINNQKLKYVNWQEWNEI